MTYREQAQVIKEDLAVNGLVRLINGYYISHSEQETDYQTKIILDRIESFRNALSKFGLDLYCIKSQGFDCQEEYVISWNYYVKYKKQKSFLYFKYFIDEEVKLISFDYQLNKDIRWVSVLGLPKNLISQFSENIKNIIDILCTSKKLKEIIKSNSEFNSRKNK